MRKNCLLTVLSLTLMVTTHGCSSKSKKNGDSSPEAAKDVDSAFVTASDSELTLPGSLALLPAKQDGAFQLLNEGDSDYQKQKTHYRVYEKSTDAVEQAGGILCFVGQTKFWEFANKGAYTALVNESECFADEGGSGDQGSSREQKLRNVIVEVTREENRAMVVKFNVEGGEDDSPINAEVRVAEGPSPSNPLGIFRMLWGEPEGQPDKNSKGMIEVKRDDNGQINLIFKDIWSDQHDGKSYSGKGLANVLLNIDPTSKDVTSGTLSTLVDEPKWGEGGADGNHSQSFAVAFNAGFLKRAERETGDEVCLNRDQFINTVYNYNLYEKATGKLASTGSDQNSLSIEYTDAEGKVQQGNASYWGIWSKDELADGAEVKGVLWKEGGREEIPYSVVKRPGKLVRYTSSQITLGELKGVDLHYHQWSEQQADNFIVHWNGSSFEKVAKMTNNQDGPPMEEPASGSITLPEWSNSYHFWVPSLSANINVPESGVTDAYYIQYHVGEVVSGDPSKHPSGNLVCFSSCPKIQPTAQELQQNNAVHKITNDQFESDTTQTLTTPLKTYTFDSGTLVLKDGATAFAMPSVSGNDRHFHMNSGPLVTQSDWNAIQDKGNKSGWDLRNHIQTFWQWESGSNDWSKFVALKDQNGNIVKFNKPLDLGYEHTAANDANGSDKFAGKKYRLQYAGPGQFWGIPWKYEADIGRHLPEFSLKNGTEVGDLLLKAIQVEQTMLSTAMESCADLSTAEAPELPDMTIPDLATHQFPDPTTLPQRVIKGAIQ